MLAQSPLRHDILIPDASMPYLMYDKLADLWPLVSSPDNYAEEAAVWRDTLRIKLGSGRHQILELGVGGGNNLSHLTSEFNATAVDISPRMLEQCRKLNPEVEVHVGDMRTVRLNRKFDAVLIHDAISYLLTESDLDETFDTARVHLRRGGVLIVSPEWYLDSFIPVQAIHGPRTDGDTEMTYLEYVHDPDQIDTTLESIIVFLIRQRGDVRIEIDRHTLGLFPLETWVQRMIEAEFTVEKRPYLVHEDSREAYLLTGTLA